MFCVEKADMMVMSSKTYLDYKRKVFDHYGNACAYCGSVEDLQLDHIAGDACTDGTRTTPAGMNLYSHVIRNSYPVGYQTLCRRCNRAKGKMPQAAFEEWLLMLIDRLGLTPAQE